MPVKTELGHDCMVDKRATMVLHQCSGGKEVRRPLSDAGLLSEH